MHDPLIQMLQFDDGIPIDDHDDLTGLARLNQLDDFTDFANFTDFSDSAEAADFAQFAAMPPTGRERLEGDPLANRSSRSAQDLVSLGKELFSALFCDSLRDSWMMAQAIAQHRQTPLRLRLGIKGEPLNRLPWEVLHDLDQPLAAGTNILFSRYRPSSLYGPLPLAIAADESVRILMVIATPNDQAELALAQETRDLLAELKRSPAAMQITLLEHPDRQTLTQALEHGNYHIFHYSGHSISGQHGGAVSLVNGKTGLTEMLSGEDLAGLLSNNGIRLAIFNSCRGAHRDPDATLDGASNLAEASIDRRIPAVLAMAERIPDDVALSLTRLFYRNLSQGVAIDLSLSRARQGLISSFGSRQLYWALPVFYLHPEFDGHLMRAAPRESATWQALPDHAFPELTPLDQGESHTAEMGANLDTETPTTVGPGRQGSVSPSESSGRSQAGVSGADPRIGQDLLPDLLPDDQLLDGLTDHSIPLPIDEVIDETITPPDSSRSTPNTTDRQDVPTQTPSTASRNSGVTATNPALPAVHYPATPGLNRTDRPWFRLVPPFILGTSILLVILGVSWWQHFQSTTRDPWINGETAPNGIQPLPTTTVNLEARVTEASTAIARGDWMTALPIVEQLLDLGAVDRAGSLLALIPVEAIDRGDVQFLKGRWAWQTRVAGQLEASYDDAWRYWMAAVERQPDNLLYRTALGWAYYADDRLEDADRVWREAIALVDSPTTAAQLSVAGSSLDRQTVDLSLKAGLALTLDQRDRSDAAIALRDALLTQDALTLQPPQLAQNWLWTAEAIGQWQTLLMRRPAIGTPPTPPPR
ncbi:MAG: CHAT domain-containing protein [Oscillatoriales cyanobacterium]|nr:MAG: CHAT domain-containing protein [Oscillatoriales cyanobacterium]